MSKYEHEFVHMMDGVEKQLETIDNPRHQKILRNYRRHALLEVSGRYKEILSPDMTVEEPVYRLFEDGQSIVLDGMDAVTTFYQSLAETDTLVMWTGKSDFAVSDSGFSGETLFSQFVPGSILGDGVFGAVHESGDPRPPSSNSRRTSTPTVGTSYVGPWHSSGHMTSRVDSSVSTSTKILPRKW
ncbi:hypothetical protein GCM10020255_108150 [Rhodococcus baikonurensis]